MEFKDILRTLRKSKGFTQADLAEKIGVTQTTVSDWESGVSQPQFNYLLALSDIFSISLDELMGKKINKDVMRYYSLSRAMEQGELTIEYLRKEYHVDLTDLANALNVSKSTLSNWEKNGLPNMKIYQRLFEMFDLSKELIMNLK